MNNMTDKQREIIELKGWNIFECNFANNGIGFELEQYSPAGEDFSFSVEAKTPCELVEGIKRIAADFDTEEHIEMWIEARHNGVQGVPSVRRLVEDADEIDEMLKDLAIALNECCGSCTGKDSTECNAEK